jgi:hypothetical protein
MSDLRWVGIFWSYIGILLVILFLAYTGMIPVEIAAVPAYDTVGHFVLLGLAAYLGHRASGRLTVTVVRLRLPLVPLLVALVAVFEEALQGLSPYRTQSLTDLAADMCGILFFYSLDIRANIGRIVKRSLERLIDR